MDLLTSRRAVLLERISRHSRRSASGSLFFPRCLRADIRALQQLEPDNGLPSSLTITDDGLITFHDQLFRRI